MILDYSLSLASVVSWRAITHRHGQHGILQILIFLYHAFHLCNNFIAAKEEGSCVRHNSSKSMSCRPECSSSK